MATTSAPSSDVKASCPSTSTMAPTSRICGATAPMPQPPAALPALSPGCHHSQLQSWTQASPGQAHSQGYYSAKSEPQTSSTLPSPAFRSFLKSPLLGPSSSATHQSAPPSEM